MEKIDARKLSPEAQQQLREQAIRLRKAGRPVKEVVEILGVPRGTISRWTAAYKRDGFKAIQSQKRGRKVGSCRTLTPEQEAHLQKLIVDKAPDQLKLPFALWNRGAVKLLIKQLWDIKMPIRTVGEYLSRWGFTPQKPVKRAYEQNPAAVRKWLDEQYPQIAAKAKQEKAEIHWGDETGLATDSYNGRSYAPKGKTPAIRVNAKRERISLISSITNQGKVRFMLYDGAMNAQTLIIFMKRLIKDSDRKVFLILDNLRSHHSKVVTQWLQKHKDQIEVFYLPPYSPELNPDEYLNSNVKTSFHSSAPSRDKSKLKRKAISILRGLQKQPAKIAKYFKHPTIAYAG